MIFSFAPRFGLLGGHLGEPAGDRLALLLDLHQLVDDRRVDLLHLLEHVHAPKKAVGIRGHPTAAAEGKGLGLAARPILWKSRRVRSRP